MNNFMRQLFPKSFYAVFAFCVISLYACANNSNGDTTKNNNSNTADVTLTLPAGFNAAVFAEGLGSARHITVNANGDVYVKLGDLKDGKGIYRLRDTNGDGKADDIKGFGNFPGTGIAIKNGYLYASTDEEVFRFKLDADNNIVNPDNPEKIVTGLLARHEHEAKAIALDNNGNLYVNIGAYSNSCQMQDRQKGSMGMKPCPILDSAGGIWQFKADKLNQTYGDGARYATGLRNVVGLDWNTSTNTLFVMQHGRDQLHDIFPDMYTTKQNAELPAECMYELHKGSNCGWPYIYYDLL
jgi:glucose/arabinose dehydrogenase